MKRFLMVFATFGAVALFAYPTFASWTISSESGTTRYITDGNWTLRLVQNYNGGDSVAYHERSGASTELDLTSVYGDTGRTITRVDNEGFKGKTDITKIILPDSCTVLWNKAFQSCTSLETVGLPRDFSLFNSDNIFDGCTALKTVYLTDETPIVGTVHFPPLLTVIRSLTFANCKSIERIYAPNVTEIGNRAFQNCTALKEAVFSEKLSAILTNGSYSDHSAFYNCSTLTNFYPSVWGTMTIGPGTFRNCYALKNYFDLSASGIAEIPSMWAAYTALEGVTFPTSLISFTGDQNFRQLQKGAIFRFLGDRPAVTTTGDKSPFYNSSHRHTFVVDAKTYPAWTNGTDFVAMSDIEGNSNIKGAFSESSVDFPTPQHPEQTLGVTIWGSGNGYYNWVVQYYASYPVTFVDEDGTTVLLEAEVDKGGYAEYTGETPVKESTAQYEYTFAGWSPDPATTVIDSATTFKATYSAAVRSYDITWQWENGSGTSTETVSLKYGDTPSHADVTKESDGTYSYTFSGWSTDGETVLDEIPSVMGAATYIAVFERHDASTTVKVSWFDEDGTTALDPAITVVTKGSRPTHAEPVKDSTVDTVFSFVGWIEIGGNGTVYKTEDLPAVNADISFKAHFTSSLRSYEISFVDHDGTVIKTAKLGYGTASNAVEAEKPANPSRDATAEYTYAFTGWSPEFAEVTGDAVYTAQYAATANSYNASFVDGVSLSAIGDSVAYAYGATVTLPTPVDHTAEGKAFAYWALDGVEVADWSMPAADTTYTATYTNILYTITWVNGNETTTTNCVYGDMPVPPVAKKDSSAKVQYTPAGWQPEIVSVTGDKTYTAKFTAKVTSPLELLYVAASNNAVTAQIDIAATIGNYSDSVDNSAALSASVGSLTVEGTASVETPTVTGTFTGLVAGGAYEWTLSASQTYSDFGGTVDTAVLRGRTWARKSRLWFNDPSFNGGTFNPASASSEKSQVRLRASVALPPILPRSLTNDTAAVVGIAPYQANAGRPAAWYAWNGEEWVRLYGASPEPDTTANIVGVVDFARRGGSAVAWYIDGRQMTTESGDWEVELVRGTSLSSFVFAGDDGSLESFSADYDVSGGLFLVIR